MEPKFIKHDIFTTDNIDIYQKYTEPFGALDYLEKVDSQQNTTKMFNSSTKIASKFNLSNLTTTNQITNSMANSKTYSMANQTTNPIINQTTTSPLNDPSILELLSNNYKRNLNENGENDAAKDLEQLLGPVFQQKQQQVVVVEQKNEVKKEKVIIFY